MRRISNRALCCKAVVTPLKVNVPPTIRIASWSIENASTVQEFKGFAFVEKN
jgi:hypothetical protein